MLSKSSLNRLREAIHDKPLVVEGCNGSLGLSLLQVLKENTLVPSMMILTTYESDFSARWLDVGTEIHHLKACDSNFFKIRSAHLADLQNIFVFFGSGYGRPNLFVSNPIDVIKSNIDSLRNYAEQENINYFAYMSTSEIFTGVNGTISEDSKTVSTPQHARGVYIETKRLGEALLTNVLSKTVGRFASYRVALAMPPVLIPGDNRVLADLIRGATHSGVVTLKGGKDLMRQYQYGPNAIYKILGSMVSGSSIVYNNAGSHIISLGELAKLIAKVYNVPCVIEENIEDESSPKSVLIDTTLIDSESGYLIEKELSLESYIRKMISN